MTFAFVNYIQTPIKVSQSTNRKTPNLSPHQPRNLSSSDPAHSMYKFNYCRTWRTQTAIWSDAEYVDHSRKNCFTASLPKEDQFNCIGSDSGSPPSFELRAASYSLPSFLPSSSSSSTEIQLLKELQFTAAAATTSFLLVAWHHSARPCQSTAGRSAEPSGLKTANWWNERKGGQGCYTVHVDLFRKASVPTEQSWGR